MCISNCIKKKHFLFHISHQKNEKHEQDYPGWQFSTANSANFLCFSNRLFSSFTDFLFEACTSKLPQRSTIFFTCAITSFKHCSNSDWNCKKMCLKLYVHTYNKLNWSTPSTEFISKSETPVFSIDLNGSIWLSITSWAVFQDSESSTSPFSGQKKMGFGSPQSFTMAFKVPWTNWCKLRTSA